jgi:four helix bundle protein
MAFKQFEDIIAWQRSQDLVVDIYQAFKDSRDFGFRDQIYKAVISISNNIAEGFERGSNADFKRFLIIAKGSASEVKSMLYLGLRLLYIDSKEGQKLMVKVDEIRKILAGLINALKP